MSPSTLENTGDERLPSGRHGLDPETVRESQRSRLLAAVAFEVAERGYAAASVSGIVNRANTSKRTFYEIFRDKQDCFLASYESWSLDWLKAIAEALGADATPEERWNQGVTAMLNRIADRPEQSRAFLIEVSAAGPEVAERRAELLRVAAQAFVGWHIETREVHPKVAGLNERVAMVMIAGIEQLVAQEMHRNGPEAVRALDRDLISFGHIMASGLTALS